MKKHGIKHIRYCRPFFTMRKGSSWVCRIGDWYQQTGRIEKWCFMRKGSLFSRSRKCYKNQKRGF